ncbi:hypothetical protein GDO81_005426 [Engystomops pustulosus]|uniref:Uncharacterized protein n=1 Tax=Engystomops pustulosus TaxID=76066 RepID=A0AAV7CPU8_ENGPU|nr:hypothetical protein GDO81_005426 [Engystomops pustulosus]
MVFSVMERANQVLSSLETDVKLANECMTSSSARGLQAYREGVWVSTMYTAWPPTDTYILRSYYSTLCNTSLELGFLLDGQCWVTHTWKTMI